MIPWAKLTFFIIGCAACTVALLLSHADSQEPLAIPPLISSLRIEAPLEFCGEKVPIEIQEIRERFEKEFLLSLWNRPQVILWLKRAHRYFPHIERTLAEKGLPEDLKYIAIVESALRPHAGSKKGAMGFWQFLTTTGRKYGLTINQYVDERRNIFKSTVAAVSYMKVLHQTFKSWTLAVAAYNMGEEGLQAEILEQHTTDYYQLYLSLETQRYIFRILSAKLIFSNPETYGFILLAKDRYPPVAFDNIQVTISMEIPIEMIARAAKTHFKAIKDLNPELRGHYLQKGTHGISIPQGASKGFQARLKGLEKSYNATRRQRIYIVKKGDNLSSIAAKYDIPVAAILIWNRINITHPIHPGDRLVIHNKTAKLKKTTKLIEK